MATRATLRTRARLRAQQDVGTLPSDTQYNFWLDEAGLEVWYDLIKAGWPVAFSTTSFTFTTNPQPLGVGTIAGVHGVYFMQGSLAYALKRLNEGKRAALMSPANGNGYAQFYDVQVSPASGAVIELLPATLGGTYRVDYVPEWPGFANDSDAWYGPGRSDELVVLSVAAKALAYEGSVEEAAQLRKEYDRMAEKVAQWASAYDLRNPAQIRDESPFGTRFAFDYPVAGPDQYPGW